MPGPIVHLIVQQRMHTYLRRYGGVQGLHYADLLSKDRCSPYTAFGSMGPDYLFFSMREYGDALGDLVNFIFDAYDAIEPFIDFYEEHIEPVVDDIEDAVEDLLPSDLVALVNQIKATGAQFSATLLAVVGKIATSQIDFFYPFYPKIMKGAPEKEWYWFDFLHYRRTGDFCSKMWSMAGSDEDLQRYCIGYASHIATDVVGHPFVNAVVGGPYRNHWHRHKLVENWIDAYARKHYPDPAWLTGCLELEEEDVYLPNNIAGSYFGQLCEFDGGKLPPKLGNLILGAMNSVYSGVPHPVTFSFDDLDDTYRLWVKWFKRATEIGQALPPTPVPPPGSATVDLIKDYLKGLEDVWSDLSGGSSGGGFSVWAIFAAIYKFIENLIETVIYTLDWIIDHVEDILKLPFAEAMALLRWLLYQVQLGLWTVYDESRFALVLGGYFFPEERDLLKNPWGKAFINTSGAHLTGGPAASFTNYPRKRQNYQLFGATELHLVNPNTALETPHAEPMPKPFYGLNPEAFISGSYGYNAFIETLYECIEAYPPNATHAIGPYTHPTDQQTWDTPQFGSALEFCGRLIGKRLTHLPNFNLDGDRGYGFKTWRVDGLSPNVQDTPPLKIETNPVNVKYLDA